MKCNYFHIKIEMNSTPSMCTTILFDRLTKMIITVPEFKKYRKQLSNFKRACNSIYLLLDFCFEKNRHFLSVLITMAILMLTVQILFTAVPKNAKTALENC